MIISCCPNCNTWHVDKEYFKCSCGCEVFTEEWIRNHPEHPEHSKLIEFIESQKENKNGKGIK